MTRDGQIPNDESPPKRARRMRADLRDARAYLRASEVSALADRLRRGETVEDGPEAEDAKRLVAFSRAVEQTAGALPWSPDDDQQETTAAHACGRRRR